MAPFELVPIVGAKAAKLRRLFRSMPRRQRKELAATMIQGAVRGWLARRTIGVAIIEARDQVKRVTRSLLQDMVDEFILDDFIPSMLLEVCARSLF